MRAYAKEQLKTLKGFFKDNADTTHARNSMLLTRLCGLDVNIEMIIEKVKENDIVFHYTSEILITQPTGDDDPPVLFSETLYENNELNADFMYHTVSKVYVIINDVEFNHYHNCLYRKADNQVHTNRLAQEVALFADKFADMECVVCYEPTLMATPCKHRICMLCVQQLHNKVCPLCRIEIP